MTKLPTKEDLDRLEARLRSAEPHHGPLITVPEALSLIAAARELEEQRWIPVTESLPEDGVLVLFWHVDWSSEGPPGFGRFLRDDDDGDTWEDVSQQDQGGESTLYYSGVTHWMPLPSPPEKQ